jgi:hypothetical protein
MWVKKLGIKKFDPWECADLWHGIIATAAPWVATTEPMNGEKASLQRPVSLDGFERIP